jgi:heavy metal translocating P-type ATPase
MKRLIRFLRRYRLFSLALAALLFSLGLTLNNQQTAAHWVLGTVSIIGALPLLWDMFKDVRAGAYGIDILAITAIVASVILGEYWAAIVVVLMLTGGQALEDYAERRAKRELDALLEHAPQKATVLRKGKQVSVSVQEIKLGEKLLIKAGEVVPVDAVILDGTASFDESSLTGESLPVSKAVGDQIISGAVNSDGAITAKATATAENSQYQQIIRMVQSAAASQSPYVRLAERYSIPFTLTAYAIAIAVWVVTGDALRFLEVIIVATPCPLLLAAPIALISGMSRASKHGIIVKHGSALEKLAEAKTIAFDKTGTLTQGRLKVEAVTAYGKHSKDDILLLAASLEQNSNHVVAHAVVEAAQAKKLKLVKAKHVKEVSGRGVSAQLQSKSLIVGRLSLLEESGVVLAKDFKPADVKQTAVYVAIDGALSGVITFSDELRSEAKGTLTRLRSAGIKHLLMITGDHASSANQVAKQLGITGVHAEMLPAGKLHVIDDIQDSQRPLVFVGDGVNDAPVLASADVGIALGARGSTAASESADMVIMLDDVSRVATAHSIARRTFRIASQSIIVGIALSVVLMLVFATGKGTPLAGALLQEVVDVVVIFNALRAHFGGRQSA